MGTARVSRGKIRVLVADREGIFRLGLKMLFAVEDDLRVVAEADKVDEVLARAETFQPDLVFIQDVFLDESKGKLISAVTNAVPRCRVIITATALSDDSLLRHVHSGAAGVIRKAVDPKLFVKCARGVHEGEKWFPERQVSTMAKPPEERPNNPPRPVDTLTRREKSIISCLMESWHNREIGTYLSISEQTVKNYLRSIYDKVGVSDRLELVLYAIHQRLELPAVQATRPQR
jgi:two-component system nitrate/nitrite response regulator NarL